MIVARRGIPWQFQVATRRVVRSEPKSAQTIFKDSRGGSTRRWSLAPAVSAAVAVVVQEVGHGVSSSRFP